MCLGMAADVLVMNHDCEIRVWEAHNVGVGGRRRPKLPDVGEAWGNAMISNMSGFCHL